MNDNIRVLLVEDDEIQRQVVADILTFAGYQVTAKESVESAILALKAKTFDVVFSDWKLANLTGLDLLNYVKGNDISVGFAIATAYGSIEHAVEAMAAGADDYLAKPFERQQLLLCINKIYTAQQLRLSNQNLRAALSEQQSLVDLVGNSDSMQRVYQRIERIADTNATVLITGESGTGKELAARALHQSSARSDNPFITVNCGAIPESLAEAELFGSKKGAFTGAVNDKPGQFLLADKGTLFLDEVGELPLTLQVKLLRVLQEGTITPVGGSEEVTLNIRVIAATHRNLPEMIAKGEFREDLYYRLNIVPIHMPPLREREHDVAQLIQFFCQKYAKQYAVETPKISQKILKSLIDYPWPGNVRELSNRIERFVLLADEAELHTEIQRTFCQEEEATFVIPEEGINWFQFERDCLHQALARTQGNKAAAAKLLGLNYKAFLYRLEKGES